MATPTDGRFKTTIVSSQYQLKKPSQNPTGREDQEGLQFESYTQPPVSLSATGMFSCLSTEQIRARQVLQKSCGKYAGLPTHKLGFQTPTKQQYITKYLFHQPLYPTWLYNECIHCKQGRSGLTTCNNYQDKYIAIAIHLGTLPSLLNQLASFTQQLDTAYFSNFI